MGSPEERMKHRKRLQSRKKDRLRSPIAKDLVTSGQFNQRIIQDKRGKKHDLDKMKFRDLVEAISLKEIE